MKISKPPRDVAKRRECLFRRNDNRLVGAARKT
jgi:hypothetical protein